MRVLFRSAAVDLHWGGAGGGGGDRGEPDRRLLGVRRAGALAARQRRLPHGPRPADRRHHRLAVQIRSASTRARVRQYVDISAVAVSLTKHHINTPRPRTLLPPTPPP